MSKVGILFPGCAFGVAGSDEGLRRFVSEFQGNSGSGRGNTRADWEFFQKYCAGYQPSEPFHVVLSERTSGRPCLHLYDSRAKSLSKRGNLITLGSGKGCFDELIKHWMATNLSGIEERLIAEYGNHYLFPNFLCLVLISLAQGEHAEVFRNAGVGGVFHYLIQGANFERLQVPSVYLVVHRKPTREQAVEIVPFRICGTTFGLTIQGPPPFDVQPSLHLDASKEWKVNWNSKVEVERFIQEVTKELNQLPWYNFLGVCFAQEKYQNNVLIDTTFSKEYVWTGGTHFDPQFKSKIDGVLSQCDAMGSQNGAGFTFHLRKK